MLAPKHSTLLAVDSNLNAQTGSHLRTQASEALIHGDEVVVDVRGVESMDVAGLSALVWVLHESIRQDRRTTLIGPVPHPVNRLLGLSGFRHLFETVLWT